MALSIKGFYVTPNIWGFYSLTMLYIILSVEAPMGMFDEFHVLAYPFYNFNGYRGRALLSDVGEP
jgi:hypothetical protein